MEGIFKVLYRLLPVFDVSSPRKFYINRRKNKREEGGGIGFLTRTEAQ